MRKPIVATLMMIPFLTLGGCASRTNDDVNKYEEVLAKAVQNSDFHSQLYVFPKKVDVNSVTNFRYMERDDLFNGSYLLYLSVKYNQTQFDAELERLDSVKAEFNTQKATKPLLKFADKSEYVAINRNSYYEYVKYDSESLEIAYVSNQIYEWAETGVKKEHLFEEVTIPSELDDGGNSYNMYYYYEADIGYYVND